MVKENQKKKILLTEDDTFIANAYKHGLTEAGLDVVIAHDGEEAVTLMRTEKPDLVLLDLVMAGKDGFSVLKDVQNDTSLSKIPIIILSNLGDTTDIERGKTLGAIDYIVKSDHSLAEVVETVQKRLKSS